MCTFLRVSDSLVIYVFSRFWLQLDAKAFDFSKSVVRSDEDDANQKACGICLINVQDNDDLHRLVYGGRQYHATCANLWLNCVDSTLPTLRLPELLWTIWSSEVQGLTENEPGRLGFLKLGRLSSLNLGRLSSLKLGRLGFLMLGRLSSLKLGRLISLKLSRFHSIIVRFFISFNLWLGGQLWESTVVKFG